MIKGPYTSGDGQKRMLAESMGLPSDHWLSKPITRGPGDHGCDPLGNGMFRMVPSGDVVDYVERCRRLGRG